jgi:hypothetical protein
MKYTFVKRALVITTRENRRFKTINEIIKARCYKIRGLKGKIKKKFRYKKKL